MKPPDFRKAACCATCMYSNWRLSRCLKFTFPVELDTVCADYQTEEEAEKP